MIYFYRGKYLQFLTDPVYTVYMILTTRVQLAQWLSLLLSLFWRSSFWIFGSVWVMPSLIFSRDSTSCLTSMMVSQWRMTPGAMAWLWLLPAGCQVWWLSCISLLITGSASNTPPTLKTFCRNEYFGLSKDLDKNFRKARTMQYAMLN